MRAEANGFLWVEYCNSNRSDDDGNNTRKKGIHVVMYLTYMSSLEIHLCVYRGLVQLYALIECQGLTDSEYYSMHFSVSFNQAHMPGIRFTNLSFFLTPLANIQNLSLILFLPIIYNIWIYALIMTVFDQLPMVLTVPLFSSCLLNK